MEVYWGLKEICDRMSWRDIHVVRRYVMLHGFPAYKKRRDNNPRQLWYAEEPFIKVWLTKQMKDARQEMINKASTQVYNPNMVRRTG